MAKPPRKSKEKKSPQDESKAQTSPIPSMSNPNALNSNIFNSLFGEIPEENTTVSLFSDNNPFRRKSNEGPEEPNKKVEAFEDSDELKKRKRKKKGDSEGGDEADETTLIDEMKKLKAGSEYGKGAKWGLEENPGSESEEVQEILKLGGEEGRKGEKKKRKRDEVEAEYEAKRYGVVEGKEVGKGDGGVVGRKRKKMESEEDVMVSKEVFDDEGKLLRTVFVGNLPLTIKKKVLIKEFEKFGEVESVRIRSVPLKDSKIPRKAAVIKKQVNEARDSVHAYVVFKTEESAQASLAHNMTVVAGNHIRVDRACPPRKKLKGDDTPLYDNKRTAFVGNLPFDVKDEEVYQLFNSIKGLQSSIEAIRVVRDPGTSLGKGIAYVLFKTRDAANLAIRKRNLKVRDRELRLCHAQANSTESKRNYPFPPETNNPPAKKFGVATKFPGQENKMNPKAVMTYQGLRASKSGIQKKTHTKTREPANSDFKSQNAPKPKERQLKRPAVAARKAKALKAAQAGIKRKPDSQTPDSNSRKKKSRKFT